jgi:hypothetical protein
LCLRRKKGALSGSFAMELPVKIRGIEEMNEELSFQFLDDELQREEEEREEEEGVGCHGEGESEDEGWYSLSRTDLR